MTEAKPLNAAQLCRVYAAAGTPILWLPDQLLRYAALLEQQDRDCAKALDDAARNLADAREMMAVADTMLKQAGKARATAWRLMFGNVLFGAVLAVLWFWMMGRA